MKIIRRCSWWPIYSPSGVPGGLSSAESVSLVAYLLGSAVFLVAPFYRYLPGQRRTRAGGGKRGWACRRDACPWPGQRRRDGLPYRSAHPGEKSTEENSPLAVPFLRSAASRRFMLKYADALISYQSNISLKENNIRILLTILSPICDWRHMRGTTHTQSGLLANAAVPGRAACRARPTIGLLAWLPDTAAGAPAVRGRAAPPLLSWKG